MPTRAPTAARWPCGHRRCAGRGGWSLFEHPLAEQQRAHWIRHRIRAGDTLSVIARRYRITVAHLRKFNQLPDYSIMAGDLLIVPVAQG